MQKLKFINANGIELDLTSGNYGITSWSGLSDVGLDIQSQKVPFHDGSVYLDAMIQERQIDLTVAVNDDGDLEKRYSLKRDLISKLTPKIGEGVLIYENDFLKKQIKAVPNIPRFSNKNQNDNGTLKANLSFRCCEPYWEDTEETEIEINYGEIKFIENSGDVDCRMTGEIETNFIQNPKIKNVTTDEIIQLDGVFTNNVFFSSEFGKKEFFTKTKKFKIAGTLGINSVAYSSDLDLFVAVGNGGLIVTSVDGKLWNAVKSNVTFDLNSVVWCEKMGFFFAAQYNVRHQGVRSYDGLTWEVMSNSESAPLTYTDDGTLWGWGRYSKDGNTWVESGDTFNKNVILFKGLYLSLWSNNYRIYWSDDIDNISYRVAKNLDNMIYDMVSSEKLNICIAVGEGGYMLVTHDGKTWEQIESPVTDDLVSITYNPVRGFICVGKNGTVIQSKNGTSWEQVEMSFTNDLTSVTISLDGRAVIVGQGNVFVISDSSESYNLMSEPLTDVISTCYDIVKFKNKYFVSCDNGKIIYSDDGESWTSVDTGTYHNLLRLCVFQNNLYAVGSINNTDSIVLVSSDGLNWNTVDNYTGWFNGVASSDDFLVCVYDGVGNPYTHIRMYDGENWTENTSFTGSCYDVFFSKLFNKFLVKVVNFGTDNKNVLVFDSDMQNQTAIRIDVPESSAKFAETSSFLGILSRTKFGVTEDFNSWIFNAIDFSGNLTGSDNFFIVTNPNEMLISSDGKNWSENPVSGGNVGIESNGNFIIAGGAISISISGGEKNENIIQKVSINSNLDFKLKVGTNEIKFSYLDGFGKLKLKFRKKYIGV